VAHLDASAPAVSLSGYGTSTQLTVTGRDASGRELSGFSVSWSSSSPTIAEVSGSGRAATVVARAPGLATITAAAGSARATFSVTVLGVRAVRLSATTLALRTGESRQIGATVEADPGIATTVQWVSADPAVATVDSDGIVTAVGVGSTTVRATATADARVSAVAALSVTRAKTLSVEPVELRIGVGERRTLVATVDGVPSLDATFATDNPAIATVNASGQVTGVQFGTTRIVAIHPADTSIRQVIPVTVEPVARDVTVVPAAVAMLAGTTRQLVADVTADAGVSQQVIWRSSHPTVAQVSSTGLVTAVGAGAASIVAMSVADTTRRGTSLVSVTVPPSAVHIVQRDIGVHPGSVTQLTADVTGPPDAVLGVTWTSSQPQVATVNGEGRLVAVSLGTTLVSAASVVDPTLRDTVTVSVVPQVATSWTASRLGGPLADRIVSLFPVSATDAWAVDLAGDLYRYDGSGWTRALAGASYNTHFQAVHGSSGTHLIAVGTGGVTVRYDGSTWTSVASGTTRTLTAVHVSGPASAVAVGEAGTILRYGGGGWTVQASGVTATLHGVHTVDGTSFAVGAGGTALSSVGTTWTPLAPPTSERLRGVFGFSATDVWVVGDYGTVLRFNGSAWSSVSAGGSTDDLRAVSGSTAAGSRVVIAGGSTVMQLVGTTFSDVATPWPPDAWGAAFDGNGGLWISGERGLVMRQWSGNWSTLNLAPDLLDVWATSNSDAWAVGEYGFAYHWNGSSWSRVPTPTATRLNTVWAAGANDAFAGGDFGTMLRWNGSAWSPMPFPGGSDILALWGTSASNLHAATLGGEVFRYDGAHWTVVVAQDHPLFAIHGTGPNDMYAVGDGGTVLHFDGTQWRQSGVQAGATPLLAGVWAHATMPHTMVVGAAGTSAYTGVSYRQSVTGWQPLALPTSEIITSVWGLSRFELFATGGAGSILRWNGSAWTLMSSGTTDFLWSVAGSPSGSGGAFAVGWNGTVARGVVAAGARAAAGVSGGAGSAMRATRGSLEPTVAARARRTPVRPLPTGAARRSVRQAHAPPPTRRTR
jgi:uncharacterized protein YjdB